MEMENAVVNLLFSAVQTERLVLPNCRSYKVRNIIKLMVRKYFVVGTASATAILGMVIGSTPCAYAMQAWM